MFRVICIFSLIVLAGCASNEDRIAARDANDEATCQSYGLKFGTPEYAQCRQNIAARRQAAVLAAFQMMQGARVQPVQVQPYMMPVSRPVNTNCYAAGAIISCQSQ
jgi:hypothetical protein